jgi:pyrroline-5-carboxylate reductase
LFQRVASKGGTTAAANAVLAKGRSAALWTRALRAAYQRARQLSQRLDNTSRQG